MSHATTTWQSGWPQRESDKSSWLHEYSWRSATRWSLRGWSRRCGPTTTPRSEEHTSELQSLRHLVCRLLLEKTTKTRDVTFESLLHTRRQCRFRQKQTP